MARRTIWAVRESIKSYVESAALPEALNQSRYTDARVDSDGVVRQEIIAGKLDFHSATDGFFQLQYPHTIQFPGRMLHASCDQLSTVLRVKPIASRQNI